MTFALRHRCRFWPLFAATGGAILATTACSPADTGPRPAEARRGTAGPAIPFAPPPAGKAPELLAALTPAPAPVPTPGGPEGEGDAAPWPVAARKGAAGQGAREGVAVLQIGDSHTAADYFTGEVRRLLQARYGDGGVGYLEVGRPHPGIRKSDLVVSADPGWSYQSIQNTPGQGAPGANAPAPGFQGQGGTSQFALSGFLARTSQAGQTLSFSAPGAKPYTDIDVEVQVGPGQGAFDALIDGRLAKHVDLAAPEAGRTVVHLAASDRRETFRRIDIRAAGGPVVILSVDARDRHRGLTYSNIGFPGATVDIVNKFPEPTVVEALRRMRPRVVVLSFGTNEGFNDKLDLARYRERYENVIRVIRSGAPDAEIVMVGPALANRLPADCRKEPDGKSCRAALEEAHAASPGDGDACPWPTPPQLGRVRDLQREIASESGIAFWDWSTIMPKHCGAEAWVTASPRLMTPDHVHFTPDGYRRGGQAFAAFIDPIIGRSLQAIHAVSNP